MVPLLPYWTTAPGLGSIEARVGLGLVDHSLTVRALDLIHVEIEDGGHRRP